MALREGQTGTAPDGTRVIVRNGVPVPLNGPKPRPEWGPDALEMPDGSIVRQGPRGGSTVLQGPTKPSDAPADIKEFQANAAARATLMDQGLADYNGAVKEGYNPGHWKNQVARGLEGNGVGNWLADVIRDNPSEKARAAELQFVDGALRTTTGANAPEPEVVRANRAYFRQPGESTAAEANKTELRNRFRDQSVRIAGPAYIPTQANKPGASRENPLPIKSARDLAGVPDGTFFRTPDGVIGQRRRGGAAPPAKPQGAPNPARMTDAQLKAALGL